MRVGWNGRYILHCLTCKEWLSRSSKLLILTGLLSILVIAFPTPSAFVFSGENIEQPVEEASAQVLDVPAINPAVVSMDSFLKRYNVEGSHRGRIAESIVSSARQYNVDPRLVAAIMIVESRANPFAISNSDSIGIMQIHLPTWGSIADREGINLFKIEDNVDFGVRILKDYIRQFGLWDGVKRYKGLDSEEYLAKVQRIYGYRQ